MDDWFTRLSTAYAAPTQWVSENIPLGPDYTPALIGHTKHKHPILVHAVSRWNRLVGWIEAHAADSWSVSYERIRSWEPRPIYDEAKKAEINAARKPLVFTWGFAGERDDEA
jgi:hypothetical protein